MRILDRYVIRQLIPIWLWCLVIFIFLSCLIDLFEHLDEILRYRIPAVTVLQYYLHFTPMVFVRACPLALLLSSAFLTSRLSRHQELLAVNASGTSLLRTSLPFVFVGWLAGLTVFVVSERVIPHTTLVYERLRQEAFRGKVGESTLDNVAIMDALNRLYHARSLDFKRGELTDLTILEHDAQNRPMKTIYAHRAIWTPHGWLLLQGTLYRVKPQGTLAAEPEVFVERLMQFPVTPGSFREPEARPETMRYAQLRHLITRMKEMGITNVRRYVVELAAKITGSTGPLMTVVMGLIGFIGAGRPHLRGHLRELGVSLGWGVVYYLMVAVGQGVAKKGGLPVVIALWLPHLLALGWSWWMIRRSGG